MTMFQQHKTQNKKKNQIGKSFENKKQKFSLVFKVKTKLLTIKHR